VDRLVIISNRVAPVSEGKSQAGGLAVAILEALKRQGGIWFGWNGEIEEATEGAADPALKQVGSITYATMPLNRRDHDEYYNGYANATLWPLLHYRLDLASFDAVTYEGYRRVNALFAEKVAPLLREQDLVWVHDYHLIPLGQELRQRGYGQRIGFFLHTPWPSPEILTALPAMQDLIEALCAYDLVGFHTRDDLGCFAQCVTSTGAGVVELADDGASAHITAADGRRVEVRVFPISIDTANLEKLAAHAASSEATQRLRDSLVGRALIIGVDRLDYSKGLPQRFAAFQELLERYPENLSAVSFLQIAPPSRSDVTEYQLIRRELETMAGHINGLFADFDWMPIRYLNRSFGRRALAGFYRAAQVGLVTPLRDGMNLVAKEYVAAQDPDDPGVLVLSRFAGAAREMGEALLVNPYDTGEVAECLQRALHMPLAERKERHGAMLRRLREYDITRWREEYVAALTG
jgi:trehalose 6-phosphate synthase